jgi:hypothetical protein
MDEAVAKKGNTIGTCRNIELGGTHMPRINPLSIALAGSIVSRAGQLKEGEDQCLQFPRVAGQQP